MLLCAVERLRTVRVCVSCREGVAIVIEDQPVTWNDLNMVLIALILNTQALLIQTECSTLTISTKG
jgi:hypothetical protein